MILEDVAVFVEIDPEFAADVEDEGGPLVIGRPLRALVASWVNAPLNLDVLA